MKIPQILLRKLGMIEDFCHCFQVNNAAKKAKVQFSKDTKGDFSGKSKKFKLSLYGKDLLVQISTFSRFRESNNKL